jgi:glycogen(starch) synthase
VKNQPIRRVVVHTPEPGAGAGQYVAEFVKALSAAGEHTVLFCPANFAYRQEMEAAGAEVVLAPPRHIHQAGLKHRVLRNIAFAVSAAYRFQKTLHRRDIVHFQFALHLGLGLPFFALARLKGAQIVLTVHDPLPHRWILPRPLRWIETTFLSIGYAMCDRLIVHNEAGRQILLRQFHAPPATISVIPHGPLAAAHPVKSGTPVVDPTKPLRLLAFGSLRENKGLHLSIAAVQHFRRAPAIRAVTLTIAGCVPNQIEKRYWEKCSRLIEDQLDGIEVIERAIDDAEIGPLFASHDAVLLPYTEFFSDSGVAMLSLSQAKPILATPAGGLGELLREADCGLLIESPTVDGLISAIGKALAAAPESLRSKGNNGFRYAMRERSWESIARRTQATYDTLPAVQANKRAGQTVVLHTPEPASSAALYVEALATALAAAQVSVRVVCPGNHQGRQAMERDSRIDVRACSDRGTSVRVSLFTKIAENLRFIVSSAKTLLNATNRGDIVHFQYILHLPFGLIFFLCAWAKRAHIVFTVHDPVPHKFLLPRWLRGLEIATLRWAYRWSETLIVHSEAGKQKLIDTFQLPTERIRVIVHGPYELKKKVRPCAESERLEVLFFGSLRENKAPHLAIKAVQQLVAEGFPIRLTIAGQVVNRKEEAYWAMCRSLIDQKSEAVQLIETFIPDDDLPELFSNSHCFVLPYTTFSSDSGVAYMALANAKPLVATGAGGLEWLMQMSRGGLRIPEPTVAAVAEALRRAGELPPAALERMGEIGAKWLLAHCGWPKVARDTKEVYAQFIPGLEASPLPVENSPVQIETLVGTGQ